MPSEIERLDWQAFRARFRCRCRDGSCSGWHQGEHVSLIGPTGSGKTTLAVELLDQRDYVVALATKPRDTTMDRLVKHEGWKKIPSWDKLPPLGIRKALRVVLWPPFRRPEDVANQQRQIDTALREMFTAGSWTIFADELFYLGRTLKLNPLLEMIWTQGRSMGLSLVGGTQRPAHVPLLAYDQATHLFFWRDTDETNLKRIGGLGGLNARTIRDSVATLRKHDVLYVNTRAENMIITRAERS